MFNLDLEKAEEPEIKLPTSLEVRDIVRETGIKTISMEKKCKKAKWQSEEALQIAVKRSEKPRRKGKL